MGFITKIVGIRFAALALIGFCLTSGAAFAGDSYESAPPLTAPDQAHCRALGEGFFAVKGSNACMKISGYVSAGVGFVEPGRVAAPTTGPFAVHGAGFTDNHVGVSVDTRFDTELGPGRLYVQVGHDSWAP